MAAGSALCATAINGILIPHHFLNSGVTGLAMVIHYLAPSLPVAWLYLVLNIPLFLMGWMHVGRRFFLYSIAGLLIFTAAVAWIHIPVRIEDRILAAVLAGILSGAGSGIILRSLGSAGGSDILSVILLQRFSVRIGSTVLGFNFCLLGVAAVLFSLELALYTLIYMYVTSHVLNLVVTGLSQRKAVMVISSRWREISQSIIGEINRGVTLLRGEGGFTGREEQVLYTVITFRELSRLKQIIRQLDPGAFVVVTETLEVMGQRIGNQPHW
jgi:uncharacterized membrane-anchored protein YitT (DUF2179 family)